MKHLLTALLMGFLLLRWPLPTEAKIAHKPRSLTIASSDVIAVVTITATQDLRHDKQPHDYNQKVTAYVEQAIKYNGKKLPEQITIWGDEHPGSICEICNFEVGRYLVFLKNNNGILSGSNYDYSAWEIDGEGEKSQVAGLFLGEPSTGKPLSIKEAIEGIRATIATQNEAPLYILNLEFAPQGQTRLLSLDAEPLTKFDSLNSPALLEAVGRLPVGSTIEYNPTCVRQGSEPTPQEIEAFRQTCRNYGLKFAFVMAG